MKKNFLVPTLKVDKFNLENVITTSGAAPEKTNLQAAEESFAIDINKVVKISL